MTNDNERIRQLEDEVARLRLIADSKRAERAHELARAIYSGFIPKEGADKSSDFARMVVGQIVNIETALIEQSERERLGLGKPAEMENAR